MAAHVFDRKRLEAVAADRGGWGKLIDECLEHNSLLRRLAVDYGDALIAKQAKRLAKKRERLTTRGKNARRSPAGNG